MKPSELFHTQELAFRTQYAELKERLRGVGTLSAGSPGTIKKRVVNGSPQYYRVYYATPGDRRDEWVAAASDDAATVAAYEQVEFAQWVERQIKALRLLGFQVADKNVAKVLIELHNVHLFDAGLLLVGTLGVMAWYNELGIAAVTPRTQDIDLARRQPLKLGAPLSLLDTLKETGLNFLAVPGFPSHTPSSTASTHGREGLRVDLLVPGMELGKIVAVPELTWSAQMIPYFEYLLEAPESAWMLAGSHCIPVRLPQAARLVWHKFYSSTQRHNEREKAIKDLNQALTLGAALSEESSTELVEALRAAPDAMIQTIMPLHDQLVSRLDRYPAFQEVIADHFGHREDVSESDAPRP